MGRVDLAADIEYIMQVNIAILTVLKGQELGWVCLGSCSLDVGSVVAPLFLEANLYLLIAGHRQRHRAFLGFAQQPI